MSLEFNRKIKAFSIKKLKQNITFHLWNHFPWGLSVESNVVVKYLEKSYGDRDKTRINFLL